MAKRKRPRKPKMMCARKRKLFTPELESLDETDTDDIPETALGAGKK